MITLTNRTPGTPVVVSTMISGTTNPGDAILLNNGTLVAGVSISFTNLNSSGLCNFTFTPTATGLYTLYAGGAVQATIDVVTKSAYDFLLNLEDEALGSWQWDKTAGTLTLVRQGGSSFATYTIVDNLTEASRELV